MKETAFASNFLETGGTVDSESCEKAQCTATDFAKTLRVGARKTWPQVGLAKRAMRRTTRQ